VNGVCGLHSLILHWLFASCLKAGQREKMLINSPGCTFYGHKRGFGLAQPPDLLAVMGA
jgi:hypothetical protein